MLFSKQNDDEKNKDKQKTNPFNLASRKCPKQCPELTAFELDLLDMVENVKFIANKNNFQQKLDNDIKKINNSSKTLVKADKTSNYYELNKETNQKILLENVTKSYKKAKNDYPKKVNCEAKKYAADFGVADKLEVMTKQQAFFTIKDHKEDFRNNPKYRLLNPTKSDLGRVSKTILQRINDELRNLTKVNQWRSSSSVIDWFKAIVDKQRYTFTIFDIQDFYPSINETLLKKSIEFASGKVEISKKEKEIIFHTRKSLLYHEDTAWVKLKGNEEFDVTMGCYDGAEICELVGLYLLNLLSGFGKENIGLYRDDGLAVFKDISGPESERIKKGITKIFKKHGLLLEITSNKKQVDYLDITFDLTNGTYKPFKKPNGELHYVNAESNHPPSILKQIPISIENRLSNNSASKEIFEEAKPQYEKALENCGYKKTKLTFSNTSKNKEKRNRSRKIIWFNPPYSQNVQTNIGRTFLNLIAKHFGRNKKLQKLFNKNTIKVSYSCMDNMEKIIKSHNVKIMKNDEVTNERTCNCQVKANCPLNGKCLSENIAYLAEVQHKTNNIPNKFYIGVTSPKFKLRLGNHKKAFVNEKYKADTELSKYIWKLKKANIDFETKWKILRKTKGYNSTSKSCNLCLTEKLLICEFKDKKNLLNERSEIVSKCRHQNKFLLMNYAND